MSPPPWSPRPRVVRSLIAAGGLFAGLCVAVVIRHGSAIGSRSPLLWGTAVVGVLAGIGACLLSFRISDSGIEALLDRVLACLLRTQGVRLSPSDQRVGAGLVLCGGLLFAINLVWVAQHQDTPDDDDQGAYLITAREIHDHGGLAGLWSSLWSGSFEESNRHPLLLAIQALRPTVSFGRMVSITLASFTLGLTLVLVWRRMGPLTSGLLSILIGTNGAWLYHAPRLVCESLLTGLAGLLWLSLFQPRKGEPLTPNATPTLSRSLVMGVLAGLVYLTKGTGLLLVAGVGIASCGMAIWSAEHRRSWAVALAAFGVSFLVIASPLLLRNAIRFGSPTYNVNSYLLWVDTYESPNAMANRMTLEQARAAYFSSHSVGRLIEREATGLAWEAFIGLRTLGPAPWEDARVLFGLPLFALGLLGLCQTPRFPALVLIAWTGIIWGAMAWYVPIAAGDRFVMPLLIPWLTLAANGLARLCGTTADSHSATRRIIWATILGGVVSTALVWSRSELWAC